MPYTAYPAKDSARCSTKGRTEVSRMVTALSGCKSCTKRNDLPSFLTTQNHRDLYAAIEGSYTPEEIFSFIMRVTSPIIEGGIGMLRWDHGTCGTVGILYGGKYRSSRRPRSDASHANASS